MMWILLSALLAVALLCLFIISRSKIRALSSRLAEAERACAKTERSLSKEREQQKAQQESLFNRMLAGVLILDGKGRVLLVNSALRRLFGLSGNIQNKTLLETIRSHELQEVVQTAANEGRVAGRELAFVSGAKCRYFSVSAAVLKESDAQSGVIVLFHDLTPIKLLENKRKDFVANVNHELRTPLSMIKGCVETLLDGNAPHPEDQERFLQKIQKHSDRLTYLIEDLLALSQLESGQIAMNQAKIPLAPLVQRVFDDLQDRAQPRSITLASKVQNEIEIWADADRIHQVIQNLVDNGIKYGKPGGKVCVDADLSTNDAVIIHVSDDGPGIPENARQRVFERFFRVDKARSREQGGTGLGLAIVKHIIQAHGGRVWLNNGKKGAVFSFSLPAETTRR